MKKTDLKEISESIEKLNDTLVSSARPWNKFLTGVITGLGTAIGAALIGTIIIGIIASNLTKIPIIRDIIPTEILGDYIENPE
jgi:hypothetical protein